MKIKANFYQYLIMMLTGGIFLLNAIVWTAFPHGGLIILGIFLSLSYAILLSVKRNDIRYIHAFFILYLSVAFAFFIVWGQSSNFGAAFIAQFIIILFPLFILLNTFALLRKKTK